MSRARSQWPTFGRPCFRCLRARRSKTLPPTRHGCKSLQPTPRTRGRMRWERRLYGMKQQAGASCLSRTPSISLAPPRLLWSTFLALFHLFSPAPFPPAQTTQTRRSSQLPRVTQRLFLPTAAPLPSFPSIYQGSKELASREECLEITRPSLFFRRFALLLSGG